MRFLGGMALVLCLICSSCNKKTSKPQFNYDLHLTTTEGDPTKAVICLHGFGGDYTIANSVYPYFQDKATVISFNFPDYGKAVGHFDPTLTSFGSIEEILPALYVLRHAIVDRGISHVCLYGFSAGGAALINLLYVLSTSAFDDKLIEVGIGAKEKMHILQVIAKGDVILDTPLKSMDEIISVHGLTSDLKVIAKRYRENGMEPIESITKWKNLSLQVLIHFQVPDEVLSNIDDDRFLNLLHKYNLGSTKTLMGSEAGHFLPHSKLWEHYLESSSIF